MFGRKKDKTIEAAAEDGALAAVSQDLIVHNMPGPAKFSGAASSGLSLPSFRPRLSDQSSAPAAAESPARGGADAESGQPTHKTIGIVIMAGGLVFIGALVYLSYIFIIKPPVGGQAPVSGDQTAPAANQEAAAVIPVSPDATTTDSGLDAVPLDTATSTGAADASGTDDVATATPEFLVWPDSDNDGLNDQEELILGTSATSTDTDGDGYQDLAEISSGYDPAGTGRLAESASLNLNSYSFGGFHYEILSPKSWPVQTLGNNTTVIFTAPDGALIQVTAQENSDYEDIAVWYNKMFSDSVISSDNLIDRCPSGEIACRWQGIVSADGLNFYLTDGSRYLIYIVSYIPNAAGRIAYPNIMRMMVDNFDSFIADIGD